MFGHHVFTMGAITFWRHPLPHMCDNVDQLIANMMFTQSAKQLRAEPKPDAFAMRAQHIRSTAPSTAAVSTTVQPTMKWRANPMLVSRIAGNMLAEALLKHTHAAIWNCSPPDFALASAIPHDERTSHGHKSRAQMDSCAAPFVVTENKHDDSV